MITVIIHYHGNLFCFVIYLISSIYGVLFHAVFEPEKCIEGPGAVIMAYCAVLITDHYKNHRLILNNLGKINKILGKRSEERKSKKKGKMLGSKFIKSSEYQHIFSNLIREESQISFTHLCISNSRNEQSA